MPSPNVLSLVRVLPDSMTCTKTFPSSPFDGSLKWQAGDTCERSRAIWLLDTAGAGLATGDGVGEATTAVGAATGTTGTAGATAIGATSAGVFVFGSSTCTCSASIAGVGTSIMPSSIGASYLSATGALIVSVDCSQARGRGVGGMR